MAKKEIKLPNSGKILTIFDPPAPWECSQALYEALLEEGQNVHVDGRHEVFNVMKDVFCVAFSSKKVKAALAPCLDRVLYNGVKITADTWESTDAREDYYDIITEVAKENVAPFTKSLMRSFSPILEKARSFLS